MYSAGKLPRPTRGVDPRLPTKGTGEYEWRGFLAAVAAPVPGQPARAACWSTGTTARRPAGARPTTTGATAPPSACGCSTAGLAKRGVHDLASVTSAMNAAATQDLRSVALTPSRRRCCARTPAPSHAARDAACSTCSWPGARRAPRRLDRDHDGVMDAGPAPGDLGRVLPEAVGGGDARSTASRDFVGHELRPGSGFTGGGFWYLDKDLRPAHRRRVQATRSTSATAAAATAASAPPRSGRRWTPCPASPTPLRGGRDRGADRVPARAAADHDPLHEPAERHPAGDLVRPAPAALGGRSCESRSPPKTPQTAAGGAAAVLAHAALDDRVLARRTRCGT